MSLLGHHRLNCLSQEALGLVCLNLKVEAVINPVSNWKNSVKKVTEISPEFLRIFKDLLGVFMDW